ncbi:type III-B CRISPR module-associated Cmr3 family protein [Clostridium sediminicola]|uniref:type III-B CRISPR module-associated Cmr3 family protein n=1 Tax=Clostridium sediminicola TaxID=3114879 RepID=UPI0031F24A62
MTKYIVTLKPIGSFFFSGEKSFKYDESKKNYFARSNKFPQQTSILGMIRKELLIREGLFKEDGKYENKDKNKIYKLIGKNGFEVGIVKEKIGVIKNLSPVFIRDGKKYYISIPKDHKKKDDKKEKNSIYTPISFGEDKIYTSSGEIYLPKDYVAKDGVSDDFLNIIDESIMPEKKVFLESKRIGITRVIDDSSRDNKFYKQVSYLFNRKDDETKNKDYKFIFELDIDDSTLKNNLDGYSNIVSLGAEGTSFKMDITKNNDKSLVTYTKDYLKKLSRKDKYKYKIILLSDTFISEEAAKYIEYSICSYVNFRYRVRRTQSEKNVSINNYKDFHKTINIKYSLMEKGSVLFTNSSELVKEIEKQKDYVQIGYNTVLQLGGVQ